MAKTYSHRQIGDLWYTWSDELDLPVSSGKQTQAGAADRAQVFREGGLKIQDGVPHPSAVDMLADWYAWVEKYGHTDPVIAERYGLTAPTAA